MSILGRWLGGRKPPDVAQPAAPEPAAIRPVTASPAAPAIESRADADLAIAAGQRSEDEGAFADAEARFREAVAAAPSYPRAHLNLGNALMQQGRVDEAEAAHRQALAIDPDFVGAHFNLGALLIGSGQTGRAREHLERVLALDPAMVDAAVLLADLREADGDLPGAKRQLEVAHALDPAHPGVAANFGGLLLELGDPVGAARAFGAALASDPDCVPALSGIARIEVLQGHAARAEPAYRRALGLEPHNARLWSSWLFSLNLRDDVSADAVAHEHAAFGATYERPAARPPRRTNHRERIRIGYVSADLLKHPVGLFLRPVLAAHDRSAFETFCYANAGTEDELTDALKASAEHWRDIARLGDAEVDALVRSDRIDVLVDLSGHTLGNRLGVFARKPAAVQATWLGYLNTTGLQTMDYRICDHRTDPVGETEHLSSEALIRLPHSQWCYVPFHDLPQRPADAAPGRPLRFGSFNQFAKVSDSCLDLWCAILRAVPDAELHVHGAPAGISHEDFEARCAARGVAADRVTLHGRMGVFEYFAAIAACDIALDTMPYNGATTTFDTLWMGTPIVALRGDRAIGRGTWSILGAAGLDALLATDASDYVARNVALANDADARAVLRATLRERLLASPVMDSRRFTNDLEATYREMLAGGPPVDADEATA